LGLFPTLSFYNSKALVAVDLIQTSVPAHLGIYQVGIDGIVLVLGSIEDKRCFLLKKILNHAKGMD
jgi:hypothetical protein